MNAAPAHGPPLADEDPPILLVVEDEVLTRHMIANALRQSGYRVVEASSAAEAMTVLKTLHVDLLFVDIRMPGEGDGLDVARFARAKRPATKIVLTSGKVTAEELEDSGVISAFVPKPYLIVRVLQTVRSSLGLPQDPAAG